MTTPETAVRTLIVEVTIAKGSRDAEFYNFLPSSARRLRRAELQHGAGCIPALVEGLADPASYGPAARFMLGALHRLLPTRHNEYTRRLDALPSSRRFGGGSSVTSPRSDAAELARREVLAETPGALPAGFPEALLRAARSSAVDSAVAALRAMERLALPELFDIAREAAAPMAPAPAPAVDTRRQSAGGAPPGTADEAVRWLAAIRAAARLSCLRPTENRILRQEALDPNLSPAERAAVFEAWLAPATGTLLSADEGLADPFSGLGLHQRLDLLDSALDSAKDALVRPAFAAAGEAGPDALPNATLRRLARAAPPEGAEALHSHVVRAMAHAAEEQPTFGAARTAGSRVGLLVHRNSEAGALWVGHCAIFVTEGTVVDASTGRDPSAVREISFAEFHAGLACRGIREDDGHCVDLARSVERAREIASWRTEYDGAHNNQKGEWIDPVLGGPRYWETDCVGFTEHCYETAGGNPTPNDVESGAGWPLTVREQRDAMRVVVAC